MDICPRGVLRLFIPSIFDRAASDERTPAFYIAVLRLLRSGEISRGFEELQSSKISARTAPRLQQAPCGSTTRCTSELAIYMALQTCRSHKAHNIS